MSKKSAQLTAALGPQLAQQLGGAGAAANAEVIKQLPMDQRTIVRAAFADSLQPMWIMYTAFAAAGLFVGFFIQKKQLTKSHQETKVGLEAEKENAALDKAERDARRASKRASKAGHGHSPDNSRPVSAVGSGSTLAEDHPPLPEDAEGKVRDLEMGRETKA